MKKCLIVSMAVLAITGCNGYNNEHNEPEPLQETSSYGLSKRGGGDLVSELYEDLAKKDPQLKQIEESIEQLQDQKTDSIAPFRKYDEKSQNYYSAAKQHVNNIADSVLKQKVRLQIENSLTAYKQKIAAHQNILDAVAIKTTSLNDLHEVLKLVKTLPVIANYQQQNLPATKPLFFINNKYKAVLEQIDTIVNKKNL